MDFEVTIMSRRIGCFSRIITAKNAGEADDTARLYGKVLDIKRL